jgi:phage RecT family recombinase
MNEPVAVIRYTKPMTAPVQDIEGLQVLLCAYRAEFLDNRPPWAMMLFQHQYEAVLVAARQEASLRSCTAQSIKDSVREAFVYDLSLDKVSGEAALVAFGNQCRLMPMYRGLEKAVLRSAEVTGFQSATVFEGDKIEIVLGTDAHVNHVPNLTASHADDKVVGAYSIAHHKDGKHSVEWMPIEDIKKIRARSRAASKGPWVTDFAEMCRKTPIRRHMKHLPWRSEDRALIERIMALDNEVDGLVNGHTTSPAKRLERMRALLAGEPETIEGEVVRPEAGGVPPSNPSERADPPALDPLVAARARITGLAATLAERGRARGKKSDAGKVLDYATKQSLGDSIGLDELSLDQAILVREWLEGQEGAGP